MTTNKKWFSFTSYSFMCHPFFLLAMNQIKNNHTQNLQFWHKHFFSSFEIFSSISSILMINPSTSSITCMPKTNPKPNHITIFCGICHSLYLTFLFSSKLGDRVKLADARSPNRGFSGPPTRKKRPGRRAFVFLAPGGPPEAEN